MQRPRRARVRTLEYREKGVIVDVRRDKDLVPIGSDEKGPVLARRLRRLRCG